MHELLHKIARNLIKGYENSISKLRIAILGKEFLFNSSILLHKHELEIDITKGNCINLVRELANQS